LHTGVGLPVVELSPSLRLKAKLKEFCGKLETGRGDDRFPLVETPLKDDPKLRSGKGPQMSVSTFLFLFIISSKLTIWEEGFCNDCKTGSPVATQTKRFRIYTLQILEILLKNSQ